MHGGPWQPDQDPDYEPRHASPPKPRARWVKPAAAAGAAAAVLALVVGTRAAVGGGRPAALTRPSPSAAAFGWGPARDLLDQHAALARAEARAAKAQASPSPTPTQTSPAAPPATSPAPSAAPTTSSPPPAVVPAGSAQQYAASRLGAYGWGQGEMGCLVPLWNVESGWSTTADNPGSGAYGIPQALPYTKMPQAAWPSWAGGQSSMTAQVDWGLGYIKGRWRTPCAAWANEQAYSWY